ncbi:MAG: TOBE domain-containing protein, partial [Burkholderiaceae bacterium]|nr:TOBE domain-containing protein [Burkholderiaceae bacterium]
ELREILNEAGTTALLVTHDQYEAFAMADVVGVMQAGAIAQWDTPYRLYHRPGTREVADFVGLGSFLPGRLHQRDGLSEVHFELGVLPIRARTDQALAGASASVDGDVSILLRPDDVIHDDASPLQAEVVRKAFRGAQFLYTLRLPSGAQLLALVPSHHNHALGERVGIRFDADHVVTFPAEESRSRR